MRGLFRSPCRYRDNMSLLTFVGALQREQSNCLAGLVSLVRTGDSTVSFRILGFGNPSKGRSNCLNNADRTHHWSLRSDVCSGSKPTISLRCHQSTMIFECPWLVRKPLTMRIDCSIARFHHCPTEEAFELLYLITLSPIYRCTAVSSEIVLYLAEFLVF